MKSKPTFLLYYQVVTKDYPSVHFVTHEIDSLLREWQNAKCDFEEGGVHTIFIEVWKDEKYISKIIFLDESEYEMMNTLLKFY